MSSKNNHNNNHRSDGQIPQPCSHLADFLSRNGNKPFRALQECLRAKPLGRAAIRREPDEVPRCSTCGHSTSHRLYACFACAAVFCHSPPESSHAAAHAESMPPGHEIAVDVDRAELFCCACRDQVYDRDFDAAFVLAQTAASTLGGSTLPPVPPPENLRKRRRVDYRPWTPDPRERFLMGRGSSLLQIGDGDTSCLPWGLRGLSNLGNTCFMNSILQALLHTPPLRNYFLSDRHNRYICQQNSKTGNVNRKNAAGHDNTNKKNLRLCLACDMDAVFSAVFSGDRKPYSPANFLYSWWQHASNLASYEQQDAHEFFISMLDGIHEKVEKDQRKPQSLGHIPTTWGWINAAPPDGHQGPNADSCTWFTCISLNAHCLLCMLDSVFGPENLLSMTPLRWHFVRVNHALLICCCYHSLLLDGWLDYLIPLSLPVPCFLFSNEDMLCAVNTIMSLSTGSGDCCIAHRVFSGILRSDVTCTACGFTSTTYDPCVDISLDLEPNQRGSAKIASSKSHHACNGEMDGCGMSTLSGCLDRFTRPERLGSDQKFFCQQCQVRQESLKQMSIRKLPLVSCFHIKRFEHSTTRNMSKKVDRYLQFPFSLDMAPYLSSSILRSRFGNRIFAFDDDEPDTSNELSSEFELFAVVTHTGRLDAGHYVTYLRLSNQWYKCDDAWITQVSENIVRAAQGYMMFYVQKMLYYKASETLISP